MQPYLRRCDSTIGHKCRLSTDVWPESIATPIFLKTATGSVSPPRSVCAQVQWPGVFGHRSGLTAHDVCTKHRVSAHLSRQVQHNYYFGVMPMGFLSRQTRVIRVPKGANAALNWRGRTGHQLQAVALGTRSQGRAAFTRLDTNWCMLQRDAHPREMLGTLADMFRHH